MHRILRMMGSVAERRPGRVLLALALTTVVLGGFAGQQSTDTDLTSFAPEGDLAETLAMVQQDFAAGGVSVQVVVDAGADGNVLGADGEQLAQRLREAIVAEPGIVEALAPGEGSVVTFLDDPSGALLSSDRDGERARAGLVVVELDPELSVTDSADAELLVADAVAAIDVPDGISVDPMGQAILSAKLQTDSEGEMGVLLGLSMLLIVGILAVQFRKLSDVLLGLGGLVVSITWMFGIGVLLGPQYLGLVGNFTQVSIIVPVLLVGLGVDYAIHLNARYREERLHGLTAGRSANAAIRTVGGALVLATMATVLGFLTNLVSPLPPLRDFGIFTAAGVLSAFVVMALLVPSARNLLDTRTARKTRTWQASKRTAEPKVGALASFMGRTAVVSERAPLVAIGVAAALTIVATVGASQIDTRFSQDDFIPADSEIGQLLERIDTLFGGDIAETTFVVLDGEVTSEASQQVIDDAIVELASVPGVRSARGVAQAELMFAEGIDDRAVLAVSTNAGQDGAAEVAEAIDAAVQPLRDAGLDTRITSELLVLEDTLDALTASQARGIAFTLAAALILLVSYYGFVERRPLIGAITMIPSVAVVAWVLGTMWLMGYSFNVLTAMVASLGIGIGVPFGIHITHRFLEDRRRYDTIDEALRQTLTHTGGAMAGSAATTAAGFGVLFFASLVPIQQFGTIVAVTIVYSLLAAVLVQPSCLKLWAQWRAKQGDVAELAPDEDHRVLEPV